MLTYITAALNGGRGARKAGRKNAGGKGVYKREKAERGKGGYLGSAGCTEDGRINGPPPVIDPVCSFPVQLLWLICA